MCCWKLLRRMLCVFLSFLMLANSIPVHAQESDESAVSDTQESAGADVNTGASEQQVMDSGVSQADGAEDPGIGGQGGPPSVSSFSGAATYKIPLEVPPGRAGITPNLALTYNSYCQNGPLGVGWSLDLGSIQRSTKWGLCYSCKDFTATINGSQAELVQRPDWGANAYEAKSEGDFSRYILNPTTGGWEVTTKQGTKYYYGSTTLSRQINPNYGTFKWNLDRVEDLNGNYMTIFYDPGGERVAQILYTGWKDTTGSIISPYNSVTFSYEARTDHIYSDTTFYPNDIGYRLKTILVKDGQQTARRYTLNYQYSPTTLRSILESVEQYKDATSTIPLLKTKFEWTEGQNSYEYDSPVGTETGDYADYAGGFKMADVNGDGLPDFVYACTNCGQQIRVLLNNGNGFDAEQVWGRHDIGFNSAAKGFQLADMNGDGMADFVYDSDGDTNIHVILSTGTGFAEDRIWGSRTNIYTPSGIGFRLADVNGDGLPDFIYDSDTNKKVHD